jgi:vacuolar-type H+-ATPase subunit F/Vma7
MATVAVIGEEVLVRGFGLAGALVLPADRPEVVRAAWQGLPGDVAVVILTRTAADALDRPEEQRLVAVMG